MGQCAKWIWYPGDFEIYHSLKLNCRREERGFSWPAYWRLDDCYHNIQFRKKVEISTPEIIHVESNGAGYISVDNEKFQIGTDIHLKTGKHSLLISVAKIDGLPCIYVTGKTVISDENWEASCLDNKWLPAGSNEMYQLPLPSPEKFQFRYNEIEPISKTKLTGGTLYDFGRETFAEVIIKIETSNSELLVYYGESLEEATDTKFSYIRDRVPAGLSNYKMRARAFRYIFIVDSGALYSISARFEYLPLVQKGKFRCSDDKINQIWNVASYTFHLNSREFFLDGIKRDRWVWSGDAVQSYLINYYLFFDTEINKRTIIALRGKDPVSQYINTIMDYSLLWIISIYDYYFYTGDKEFVRFIFPRMKTLMEFCIARTNKEKFIEPQDGDWVFIDWAEFDKTGVLCAEQMLFARSLQVMADCCELIGKEGTYYRQYEKMLRQKIDEFFWNEELGGYVDSYVSGRNHITRHANIFALIYGFADANKKERIVKDVIFNKNIPDITTPYFQFYELDAMCRFGKRADVMSRIRNYWGGMIDLGATTFWEEYNPAQKGLEHYEMYGDKYGKSLCHAWGASPVYLLGKYYLGVKPTSPGYDTFEIEPFLGDLDWIEGTVPLPNGEVKVYLDKNILRVNASKDGGTVIVKSKKISLKKNVELEIKL